METKTLYKTGIKYFDVFNTYASDMTINRITQINWALSIKNVVKMSTVNKNIIIKNGLVFNDTSNKNLVIDNTLTNNTSKLRIDNKILDLFWSIVSQVHWYDADEKTLNKKDITNIFSKRERKFLLKKIDTLVIPTLKDALAATDLLQYVDIENHNNILAHIIIKGKPFYDWVIQNPGVSLYLVSQYYPVYDWLYI
jgi:hypothetical protein